MQEAFDTFSANPRLVERAQEASRTLAESPEIQVRMQEMLRTFMGTTSLVERVQEASSALTSNAQRRARIYESIRSVATDEEFQESLQRTISATPPPVLSDLRDDFELLVESVQTPGAGEQPVVLSEAGQRLAEAFDSFAASGEVRQAAGLTDGGSKDDGERKPQVRRGETRRVALVYAVATYLLIAAALHGTNAATTDNAVFDPYKLVDDQIKALGFALTVFALVLSLRDSDR
ncbi:hypothetical protein [Micromonospora fulviviridis]|uniref:hypothetical protein n=1 Tax=Micromonospora fulviviridis TaxID=47860 RepID=UPI0037AB012E